MSTRVWHNCTGALEGECYCCGTLAHVLLAVPSFLPSPLLRADTLPTVAIALVLRTYW